MCGDVSALTGCWADEVATMRVKHARPSEAFFKRSSPYSFSFEERRFGEQKREQARLDASFRQRQ
jgi:hypothetical protein